MDTSVIQTDRRAISAERAPEAALAAREARRPTLDAALVAAKALAEVDLKLHFVLEGCASIREFGLRCGYGPQEVKLFVRLGRAIRACRTLESEVRNGVILPESAASLARILENPEFQKEGDDWLEWARSDQPEDLRRRVRARVEEVRQQATVVELRLHVTATARESFGRARVLASRKERRSLTDGQAFERVVNHYLTSFDELQRRSRRRRLAPTELVPFRRAIPAAVRRAVRRRAGERCEASGCDNRTFLQFCHVRTPHSRGGGREENDLALLCSRHHTLLDAGVIDRSEIGVPGGERAPPG